MASDEPSQLDLHRLHVYVLTYGFMKVNYSVKHAKIIVKRCYMCALIGPHHKKIGLWEYAYSKDPDQPVHPHSLIRASTVC